ncbi:MAG: hypothetical protein AAF539_15085 [Planctomycetota bacterium]
MTTAGIIVMVTSISIVLCLLLFCLVRIFTLPPVDDETPGDP